MARLAAACARPGVVLPLGVSSRLLNTVPGKGGM